MMPLILAMRCGRGILADALLVPQHSFTGRVAVQPKVKHTMSGQGLGFLLRQLWLYMRLRRLGRFLVQTSWTLLGSSITHWRPAACRNSMLARAHRIGVCGED